MSHYIQHKDQILSQFVCQETGNCCRAEGRVYVTPLEINKMASLLGLDEMTFRQQYVRVLDNRSYISSPQFRQDCFLDDDNRCQVYAGRPAYCKAYPDVPDVWESDTQFLNETRLCKGLALALEAFEKTKTRR